MDWEIGISTGIAYEQPIASVIGPLARAGFKAIEVSTAPHHLDVCNPAQVAEAASLVRAEGLRVHSLHAPFGHDVNITSPEEIQRRRALDTLIRAADSLATLHGRLYVIHPGGEDQRWIWDRERRLELAVHGLGTLWKACRERGLRLVVETPLPHLLGGQVEDFAWILERLPREGTGVCLDTSHAALGAGVETLLRRFGSRLLHVQASDNQGVTDDHLPPGEGGLDWPAVLAGLRSVGYQGAFMLEVSGAGPLSDRLGRVAQAVGRLERLAPQVGR
jgi:sugar phosphate isomerase/epimerase